jgi:glycosyltransferase EpsF
MSKKNHVLQVVGEMNRGGAEVMLMDVYRNISPLTEFSFLVNYKINKGITEGDFDQEITNKGTVIRHIGTQWGIGPIKYIREFKKIYNELGKPEVVHIHLNAKCGLIALAARMAGAKKIIAHSHADLKFRGSGLRVFVNKLELFFQKILIYRNATDFWGASKEANESLFYMKKRIKDRTLIINNAVDAGKFQNISEIEIIEIKKILNISEDKLVIGSVGRIVRHKSISFIIDVLSKYKKKNENFVFLFAGRIDDNDYFNEIKEKIESYNLSKNVIYLGNRGDIPTIVNVFDVFISPALKEGFGLVAVEAQAAGVPCVLYKGFPKLVDMGLDIIEFMDDFNITKWCDAIEKCTKKESLNKEDIKKAIQNKGFDIKMNTKKIEKLYTV